MLEYHLLKELENNPGQTQRGLAKSLNVSLGKMNYMLSGLVDKGIIKAKKLKNHPEKIRWQYILTPSGIKEKIRVTHDYLVRRTEEYDSIAKEISELKSEIKSEIKSVSDSEL